MRVAHISDLHVHAREKIPAHRYLNKRFTGWVNLKLRRHAAHQTEVLAQLLDEIRAQRVDHVVVTGDVSNLALEDEFKVAEELLAERLGLPADKISMVPGNHDLYTSGSARAKRFYKTFEAHLASDVPVHTDHPAGAFPYVQLRGPLAIIGLSSALPRLPLFADGAIGRDQLKALDEALSHAEVKKRLPVVLLHHPPFNPPSKRKAFMNGLVDADALREVLGERAALVLHGHLHRRMHVEGGAWKSVGATSASLVSEHPDQMAGFNVYEVKDGAASHAAQVLGDGGFAHRDVPTVKT